MGQASHIQANIYKSWDHAGAAGQVEQKVTADQKTIAAETVDDENFLKTLVCLERNTQEHRKNTNHSKSTSQPDLVFYDDRIVIPKALRRTIIMLQHKGHAAINKMTSAAKLFWWPKLQKDIQQKCEKSISCRIKGKSIKPQMPRTEYK